MNAQNKYSVTAKSLGTTRKTNYGRKKMKKKNLKWVGHKTI